MGVALILSYLVAIADFAYFAKVNRERSARNLQSGYVTEDDRGSGRFLLTSFILSLLAPIWLTTGVGHMWSFLGWVGLGWMVGGVLLRLWAIHVNQFFVVDLTVSDDMFICTDGPYKVIRHPGYMGTLLIWVGFGLAATNWFVLIFVAGLVTYALIRRIQVEEEVLFERFGVDYQAYADETARLFPFLY
ncbi:hypothetical protein K450DRAFT_243298 [Umbelopsis ramanniana AG]|uniref:Protein-S-isoprenylcysteine O-methyltransferase n=1 Tax=Umbelopsis ramanniana AG TaxID=1314678 RepID=A0AAD5HCM3_UMBRA|nr:uncharacterized protein K450DRAFT_243298 [Umbelopsis ramanniana AG]KAI8579212.1 hypothetical protein K450DRAFT_243298 [Umbelopsis ramanniana AG]